MVESVSSQTAEQRVLSDRYRLTRRLGVGGVGEVWRATDQTLARDVAVKLLREQAERDEATRRRFRGEATAAAALSHPNAVTVYDIGQDGGRAFLVMEFVDGPSLDEVLVDGPIDPGVVAAIGERVGGALGEAHGRGLVHRDVKPGNVLLSRDGEVKVADFGIAKALGDVQTRLTSTGTIIGTAAYLAPEQLRDENIDPRADVYALGLVLFECLTGQPPFGQGTPTEIAARRLTSSPRPPIELKDDLPEDLSDVIVTATALEPEDRYADGGEMARALRPVALRLRRRPEAAIAELVAARAPDAGDGPDRRTTGDTPPDDRSPARDGATIALPVDDASGTAAQTAAGWDDDTAADVPTRATPADDRDRVQDGRGGVPAVVGDDFSLRDEGDRDRDDDGPRFDGARWVVIAGLLVAVLAVVTGIQLFSGGDPATSPDAASGSEPASAPASDPSPTEAGDGGPAPVSGIDDFDPLGDGAEHADEVAFAADGDPGTAWETSRYNSSDLGGLKSGVGLLYDLGEQTEIAEVRLTASPGIDVSLYASEEPFRGDPAATGDPVARAEGIGAETTLEAGASGRYWLLWVTRVSPDGRATIAETEFIRPGG